MIPTPKKKAKELYNKYLKEVGYAPYAAIPTFKKIAKQCALIAADEMMPYLKMLDTIQKPFYEKGDLPLEDYCLQVKEEIEKI